MIAIVDYRAGNLTSVKKALDFIGADPLITADPDLVARAAKVIVPGVGHFSATRILGELGLQSAVQDVIQRGKPFLGICVGMQWLFESSEEAPEMRGLSLFPGQCERFPKSVKSPHVGWNKLQVRGSSRLLRGIAPGAFVYFTHSYRAPVVNETAAECEYGGSFSAVVEREQLFGIQFHPEKSGAVGLKILENFCKL